MELTSESSPTGRLPAMKAALGTRGSSSSSLRMAAGSAFAFQPAMAPPLSVDARTSWVRFAVLPKEALVQTRYPKGNALTFGSVVPTAIGRAGSASFWRE